MSVLQNAKSDLLPPSSCKCPPIAFFYLSAPSALSKLSVDGETCLIHGSRGVVVSLAFKMTVLCKSSVAETF